MVIAQAELPRRAKTYEEELEDLQGALDALGISEQDALDFAYGIDNELLNPSTPFSGTIRNYTLDDVFRQIRPEATPDDFQALFAVYVAGKRSNNLRLEVPRAERYEAALEKNVLDQDQFFDSLPEGAAAFLRSNPADLGFEGTGFTRRLIDNLSALDAGEMARILPDGFDYETNQPLPELQFTDREMYLDYELEELRRLYPNQTEGLDSTDILSRYGDLKHEEIYLNTATAETFEVLAGEDGDYRGNIGAAQATRFFDAIGAPGRFGLDLYLRLGDDTPQDYQELLNRIDPRIDSISDAQRLYPITLGRTQFSFNSNDVESFGISGSDIGETTLDITNVIPLKGIDDLASVALKSPITAIKLSGRALIGAGNIGLDVASKIGNRVSINGLEALRALSRDVPAIDDVSYRTIEPTHLSPSDTNISELQDILNTANPEFTTRFTEDILRSADGERVAGITRQNEMIVEVALNYGDPTATTYHEALHSALGFLPDNAKRLLRDSFEGSQKGWQEAAADAFSNFSRSATDPSVGNTFTSNTVVGRLFGEISNTFEKLNNFFRQRGYQTADQLFARIRSGEAYSDAAGLTPTQQNRVGNNSPLAHTEADQGELGRATFQIVDANDLITSHDLNNGVLTPNANYTSSYQVRDRNIQTSRAQIFGIANDLKPELIVNNNPSITDGTPIITKHNSVLSGNGRALALKEVARRGTYSTYTKYLGRNLEQFGLTPQALEGVDFPVLVRVADDASRYSSIARYGNISSISSLRATESILSAVNSINPERLPAIAETLLSFQAGKNQSIRKITDILQLQEAQERLAPFIRLVVPQADRNRYYTSGARLNQDGIKFVAGAFEALALDLDDPVQRVFFERFSAGTGEATEALANLKQGLIRTLPRLLKLKVEINAGRVEGRYNLSHYLAGAANWLYEQLIQPGFNRIEFFGEVNNLDLLAGQAGEIPVEIYRHLAVLLYVNSRSAPAIARLIDSYAGELLERRIGLFQTQDISELTFTEILHRSFVELTPNTFKAGPSIKDKKIIQRLRNESEAYEVLYARAKEAAKSLPDQLPSGEAIPDEIRHSLRNLTEVEDVGLTDEIIGGAYGRDAPEQALTREVLKDPPRRTSHVKAKINIEDSPDAAAKKVRRALKSGNITGKEAVDILKVKRMPTKEINQIKAITPENEPIINSPTALANDTGKVVENIKPNITDSEVVGLGRFARDVHGITDAPDELVRVRNLQNEAVETGTTELSNLSERLNNNIRDLVNVRRDRLGLIEAGVQIVRFLGIYKSNSERIVSAIFQRVDNQADRIRAFTRGRASVITKVAGDLGVDLKDFRVSVKIYRALDSGDQITNELLSTLTTEERAVYGFIRDFVQDRERWILETTSDLITKVAPDNADIAKNIEVFRESFFLEDWFHTPMETARNGPYYYPPASEHQSPWIVCLQRLRAHGWRRLV